MLDSYILLLFHASSFTFFLVDLIINFDTRLVLQQLTSFKVFKNILWHTSCSYCRRTTWQDADTLQDHPSAPTTTVGAGSIRWCRCQKSSAAKISYPWRIYFTLWGGDAMRQGGMEKAGALQDFRSGRMESSAWFVNYSSCILSLENIFIHAPSVYPGPGSVQVSFFVLRPAAHPLIHVMGY